MTLASDIADPYALFKLREPFGSSLCPDPGCKVDGCESCPLKDTCAYFHAFGQRLATDPSALKRFQKPPLPFVFDLPVLPPIPNAGSQVEIGLTLVGTAVYYCSEYVAALRRAIAGTKGKPLAEVTALESVGYQGERQPVVQRGRAAPDGLNFLSFTGMIAGGSGGTVTVALTTPLRLMHEGQVLHAFLPSVFLRGLMRRVSALAYYYGQVDLDFDYKWLAAKSAQVRMVDDRFQWKEWTKALSGVIGRGVLEGDLEEFHPFLQVGSLVHLGKSASFGLGRFELVL